jgi:hypothetical protein
MANAQTFPSSLFPLRGDISAEAGQVVVTVIGLQGLPFSPQPLTSLPGDGAVPTFVAADADIQWLVPTGGGSAVEINGVGVSEDKQFFINAVTDGSAPTWVVQINGTLDGG